MDFFLPRVCGNCTACCKTHAVMLFNKTKKSGTWCPHCETNRGCQIYPNRPRECKKFKCDWLKGVGEEEHRPDRVKIVLDSIATNILLIFEVNGGEIRNEFARHWKRFVLIHGISIGLIHLSGKKEFIASDAVLLKKVRQQLEKEGFKIIPRRS